MRQISLECIIKEEWEKDRDEEEIDAVELISDQSISIFKFVLRRYEYNISTLSLIWILVLLFVFSYH